jgi:hypothetical protein
MKSKTAKTKKRLGLITSRSLTKATFRAYRANWRIYMLVVAVIVVPVNILNLSSRLASAPGFTAYAGVASLLMNLALIYTTVRIINSEKKPTIREAYYEGTASMVRFTIAAAALLVMMVPLAIGGVVSSFAASAEGVTAPLAEQLLLNGVAWLISLISLWWLTRFGLSVFAVVQDGATPWRALKAARRLTLRRFWRVLGRLLFMLLILAIGALALSLPIFLLSLTYHNQVVLTALYKAPASILLLPFFYLYLLGLYRNLKETSQAV